MSTCFRLSGVAMLDRISVSLPTFGLHHLAIWQLLKRWSHSRHSDNGSKRLTCLISAASSLDSMLRMFIPRIWCKTSCACIHLRAS